MGAGFMIGINKYSIETSRKDSEKKYQSRKEKRPLLTQSYQFYKCVEKSTQKIIGKS